jgi:pimeloyl-ACP methyl ester carboxylesterase
MPFRTIPGTDGQYALLSYDKDGRERTGDPDGNGGPFSAAVIARAVADRPTHVFLFIHGWKGDLDAAVEQYDRWIKAMLDREADRRAMPAGFKPLWIGLHWPSLPFGDEEFAGNDFELEEGAVLSPDELRAAYVDRLGLDADARPLLDVIIETHRKNAAATELPPQVADAYRTLAARVGYQSEGPSGPPDAEGAPFVPEEAFARGQAAAAGANFAGGGFLGGILGPLRQLSYWTMKKRARSIGEGGMHRFVSDLMNALPDTRIHLMGHSFGTIVVSGILGGPGSTHPLPRQVDSVALIQGAVSLWAFGDSVNGKALKGYFNPWVHRPAVRGPVIVSRSIFDKAVGTLYPWASAVSFSDGDFDVDDEDLPLYGAIGKYGIRALPGLVFRDMLDEHGQYGFEPGKVYNLQASAFIRKGGGISGAHSDIDGPQVAHALWQAALA